MLSYPSSSFTSLPLEILDAIAFELAASQPLGPPFAVSPLLTTCVRVYNAISPATNPGLWSRIFRFKFDTGAVERRAFVPTPIQCVEQLVRCCTAMQIFRCANRFYVAGETFAEEGDMDLEEALMVAVVMMMEDDGKNARQLCQWAGADHLVDRLVRTRLFEEGHAHNGWPAANQRNSCAIWLLWMFTSSDSLRAESKADRDHLNALLLPFVSFPYRYASAEAPPQCFRLPWPSEDDASPLPMAANTTHTMHGPYPVWPARNRAICDVHYGTRPVLHVPLVALAARLLYFARQEVVPLFTPPHLARNREEHVRRVLQSSGSLSSVSTFIDEGGQGFVIGATKEDLEEFNWGWTTRPPFAERWRDLQDCGWGLQDCGWGLHGKYCFDHPLQTVPSSILDRDGRNATCLDQTFVPHPRWVGKAPQTFALNPTRPKSALWDADWWRLRFCGDPQTMRPMVPYGKVYEPGCMDGFWQGKMFVPHTEVVQQLITDPNFPGVTEFNQCGINTATQPFYVRFREAHSVVGFNSPPDHDDDDNVLGMKGGANMNNAWFDGRPGSTKFHVRPAVPGEVPAPHASSDGAEGGDGSVVEIEVTDMNAETARTKIVPLAPQREPPLLGNDSCNNTHHLMDGANVNSWTGYAHCEAICGECQSRARVRRRLEGEEREERARRQRETEALFTSIGLGVGTSADDDGASVSSYSTYYDGTEHLDNEDDEDDEDCYSTDSHDPSRLAHGTCDGIKEIFLIGETDGRHRDAWGGYEFYGRVRSWDGLIGVLRRPKRRVTVGGGVRLEVSEGGVSGNLLFYGYLIGGENWVGSWRYAVVDGGVVGYEGAFVMSRRTD